MSTRDFERNPEIGLMPSVEERSLCASVNGWEEDAFAQWVAGHRDEVKDAMCRTSEFRKTVDCGMH